MKKMISILLVAGCASISNADVFSESEGNNTLAIANNVGSYGAPGGSVLVDGVVSGSDVDWFTFTLEDSATLSFFAVFSASGSDGVMQLVAEGGDVIAFDDNSGINSMPAIQLSDLDAGVYYVGLSGFGDVDASSVGTDELLDGMLDTGEGHNQDFGYKLSMGFTIVPAPGSMALLGMGGMMMVRRKR